MVDTDGAINCCCIATSNLLSDAEHIKTTSLKDAWKSKSMYQLRKKMLNGKKSDGCSVCYTEEKFGKQSYRLKHNKEWEERLGTEKFNNLIQHYKVDGPPVYLDLKLGNKCNLKCRSCNPYSSDQIANEHFDLYSTNNQYHAWYETNHGKNPIWMQDKLYLNQFEDNPNLWDSVFEWMPYLKKIYVTGGEPTLIKKNIEFLTACADKGYAKQISLFLNTNCTTFNKKFTDALAKFDDDSHCLGSIDGIGKVNEYIRGNSKWTIVEKNYTKYLKLNNIKSYITPVLQIYNLNSIHEILIYANKLSNFIGKQIGVDILINYHQKFLDVRNLPIKLRQNALNNLNKCKDEFTFNEHSTNSIEGAINFLQEPQLPDYKQNLNDFVTLTEIYDKKRNQSFNDIDEKLYTELKCLIQKII